MSNFYGGKQGFSFFISKLYILKKNQDNKYNDEFNSIESFLINKFNTDSDVHYNDYVLIAVMSDGEHYCVADPYHGNLYRKDITEFKLVGNLAGPPGGTSQVEFLDWNEEKFKEKYTEDKNDENTKEITPVEEERTSLDVGLVDGKTHSKIKIKYYCVLRKDLTSVLKMAIQTPVPYIDFTSFYKPEINGDAPLMVRDTDAEMTDNLFYQPYKYPIVTKYYKPRIENDELFGDLYEYEKDKEDENKYSYQVTGSELLGQIKQENGILIGKNIVYYILTSEAGNQTDVDLQEYLNDEEKRKTLITSLQDGYSIVTNKKLICKKLNDDYPCGLGYQYAKTEDGSEDKTKREISNIELVGKIVSYGDKTGPISENKAVTWFFGYDFSRSNLSEQIIPNWYFLNLTASQIKIIFAEDQDTENGAIPATSEEIKAGDLWVGLVEPTSKEWS